MRGVLAVVTVVPLVLLSASAVVGDVLTYNIYQIQFSDSAQGWRSPLHGDTVCCVGGIVTHIFKNRFALQDTTLGSEWSAIEVQGFPVYPFGIEVGDQVDFDSVCVDEVAGVTVLKYYDYSSHVVNSTGNPLPEPLTLSLSEIRYPAHPELVEKYASMLVAVEEDMTIGAMDLGKHDDNYELIGQFGDTAWASDYGNTEIDTATYYVSHGECYRRLVGILQRYDDDAEWDYYQLLPRGCRDYYACYGSVELNAATAGNDVQLEPAHPNPFNPTTAISFFQPRPSHVRLAIYDVSGRRVVTLADRRFGPGRHEIRWDGESTHGHLLASGVYFVRLHACGKATTGKVCLAR